MAFKTLTPAEESALRLAVLLRDYERIDTVLAGRSIKVEADFTRPDALAWSPNGNRVMIGGEVAGRVNTVDDVIGLTGVNYHELCHQLFTYGSVREESVMRIAKSNWGNPGHHVWNALDDQRIETLFTTQFSPTTPYFTTMVTTWLLRGSTDRLWAQWPLLIGRTYLDRDMVKALKVLYIKQEGKAKADTVERLTKQYVGLGRIDTDSKVTKALDIIRDLLDVLTDDQKENMGNGPSHSAAPGEKGVLSQSFDGSSEEGEQQDGDGGGVDGDGDHEQGDGSGNGDQGDDTDSRDTAGGKERGFGDNKSARESIGQQRQDAMNDPTVQSETTERLRVAKSRANGQDRMILPTKTLLRGAVPVEATQAMRGLSRVFERVTAEVDPGRLTHVSSGKVNMGRAMHDPDFDTVFDQWEEGQQDATDMEVVILGDVSSSMRDIIHQVSAALWAIQRGIELSSPSSTVNLLQYSTESKWVCPRGERAHRDRMFVLQSELYTDPRDALEEARNIFASSRHSKGLLFIVTDGDFDYDAEDDSNDQIQRIKQAGITTALAYIQSGPQQEMDGHGCHVARQVQGPMDLVPFAREVVSSVIRSKGRS